MSAASMIRAANTVATIQRNTPTKDSSGGNIDGWSNHLTNIAVAEQEAGGDEVARYERETNRKRSVWFALTGQDIQARDRMIVGDRTLNIINADDRTYGARGNLAHMHIDAEETL